MKNIFRNYAKIEWLYLAAALVLPLKSLHQPPDALIDYYPIRDAIRLHWFSPEQWLSPERLYRVPGYPFFLALLSLLSLSDTWIRLAQGFLVFHSLVVGKKLARKLGADPQIFAWAWTLTLVHFYFAQLVLTETLATWLLINALHLALDRHPKQIVQGLLAFCMLMVKPAFSLLMPLILWPWWKKKGSIALIVVLVISWGLVLKPRAGKWVFLGAGGGLNLFIATLPGTFDYQGEALDAYWLREQRKIGHPAEMGWYKYDDALKKEAMRKFPHWNLIPARFWSPFFGLQYQRGFQWKLLPFGMVLLVGLACSLFFQLPLVSLIFISSLGAHLILAPFARFVAPLTPLAALLIAKAWSEYKRKKEATQSRATITCRR